tara:strand:+ start:418 stop:612 length:195 start_codon:yes stop_codon:yes gene_type:complete
VAENLIAVSLITRRFLVVLYEYVKNVDVKNVLILHICRKHMKRIREHLSRFMIRVTGIGNNVEV